MMKAGDSKREWSLPCFPQGSPRQCHSCPCVGCENWEKTKSTIEGSEVALMISGLGNALIAQNRLKIGFGEL